MEIDGFGLSIIIPYYRGEDFIHKNLESIYKSYEKSAKKICFEVIIIIDSEEEPQNILRKNDISSSFIRIYKNDSNIGVAKSRNRGLSQAKYNWITFIDQDDFVEECYFPILEYNLTKESFLILLNGFFYNVNKNRKTPIYYFKPKLSLTRMTMLNCIHTPGLLIINKKYLTTLELFKDVSEYKGVDDWYAWLSILKENKSNKFTFINSKLLNYTIHDNNFSKNTFLSSMGSIEILNYFKNSSTKKLIYNFSIMRFKYQLVKIKKQKAYLIEYILLALPFYFVKMTNLNKLLGSIHRSIISNKFI